MKPRLLAQVGELVQENSDLKWQLEDTRAALAALEETHDGVTSELATYKETVRQRPETCRPAALRLVPGRRPDRPRPAPISQLQISQPRAPRAGRGTRVAHRAFGAAGDGALQQGPVRLPPCPLRP